MSELATRTAPLPQLRYQNVPAELSVIINVEQWVSALLRKTAYHEPNPDFVSIMLAWQTITAETAEEVFRNVGVRQLQKMIADTPGANSGPIEITDLYVAESDYETGNPSYVIITATDLETGDTWKATTGATTVQATILGLLLNGMWPIRCKIMRADSKDRGGRHILLVVPPD